MRAGVFGVGLSGGGPPRPPPRARFRGSVQVKELVKEPGTYTVLCPRLGKRSLSLTFSVSEASQHLSDPEPTRRRHRADDVGRLARYRQSHHDLGRPALRELVTDKKKYFC